MHVSVKGLVLRLLALSLTVLFVGQQLAAAQSADAVVERLQKRYEAISGLEATFTQTMSSEFLETPESSEGRIVLSGKQMRIETGRQTFVTDGVVTWLYDTEVDEVLVNDYVEEEMFPVREFLFDYDDTYEVVGVEQASAAGERVQIVRLRARDESSPYREIAITVRDRDDVITKLDILDVNETRMIFELKDVVLNPDLVPATFSFSPPDGTTVIDLRS